MYQGDIKLTTNRKSCHNAYDVSDKLRNNAFNVSGVPSDACMWWFNSNSTDNISSESFRALSYNEGWNKFQIQISRLNVRKQEISELQSILKNHLEKGNAPVAVGYTFYDGSKHTDAHIFTCWGLSDVIVDNASGEKYLLLYITDSDTNLYITGDAYETMWLKQTDAGIEVVQQGWIGMPKQFCINDVIAIESNLNMDNMLANLSDASRPMYWTGQAAEWEARSLKDASGIHLAELQDGWKKEVGEGIWAHAYFHNENEKDLPGSVYDNLKASSTGFVFADTVDGVTLSKSGKRVMIPENLQVKSITVEGKDYVFEGSGMGDSVTLTAADGMLVQNGGALTLSGNVNISVTSIELNSGSLKAYIPGRTTITGGSVTLLNNSILWCAGLVIDDVFSDGAIAIDDELYITSRMISVGTSSSDMSRNMTTTILSDGSGRLGAYVDFGGSRIDFYTLKMFGNESLDSVFSIMAGVEDAPSEYKYVYEWRRFTTEATADELSADKFAVADSTLTITGGSSRTLTIGSHSLTADENSANVFAGILVSPVENTTSVIVVLKY